jgi:4-oxalocrotonate tautomerase
MPLVQVHLAAGRTKEQKTALLTALTDAVHSSIGAPMDSIRVWLNEVDPTEFMAGGVLIADRRGASDR